MLFLNPLCALSALRGFILINHKARRDRKGFGYGLSTQNYYPLHLRALSALRGFIFN